jgi:hypothetical protein
MAAAASSLVVLLMSLYLVWRVAQLWSAPLQLIFRYVQIELPASPRLTVDALSSDSVSLHWAPPESYVKKHIIQMDGQEVGISVRGETSVTISGLTSDFLYSIQVIAVNAHGFQVASPVFYVKTRPRPGQAGEVEANHDVDPQATAAGSAASTSVATAEVSTVKAPKKKASLDVLKIKEPLPNAHAFAQDHAKAISDLTFKMESILRETSEIEAQIMQLNNHHAEEEQVFSKKLEDYRQKKKSEDDARSARDQHHKQLDQQKREIETRRNQVQKALKTAQDDYRKQCADIEGFAVAMRQAGKEASEYEAKMQQIAKETDESIKASERVGAIALEELAEVEAEIRYLLSRKAEGEAELAKLQSASRVASPTPHEVREAAKDDAQWKEREETLVRQYEDASQQLLRLQQGIRSGTPISEGSSSDHMGSMRQRKARKAKEQADNRNVMPSFNPDAMPFVASANAPFFPESSGFTGPHYDVTNHPNPAPGLGRETAPPLPGTTSIFNDDTIFRRTSPFPTAVGPIAAPIIGRRESPRSSQSGSNPSSPGVVNPNVHIPATYNMLPSIFNAQPSHHLNASLQLERGAQRATSGSLVASLNGTPLNDSPDHSAASSAPGSVHNMQLGQYGQLGLGFGGGVGVVGNDRTPVHPSVLANGSNNVSRGSSNWFWPSSSKKTPVIPQDPLALDRKATRSLPKADVAPIGTRRPRSGSLRGEDGGVVPPIGSRLSRTYQELDRQAELDQEVVQRPPGDMNGLPKPADAAATRRFGWHSFMGGPG